MLELKSIKAVSFDVGGTLIATHPSAGAIYAEVAGQFGVRGLDAASLDRQFAEAWQAKGEFDFSTQAWFALVRRVFGDRAAELPEEFFPALYARFEQADSWRVYPDVLPVLDELASMGVPMAIVSNWDERLKPLMENLKLAGYFDTIINSSAVAFHKPCQVVFEMVVRRLGVPPAEILHVGDHFKEDVEGARAAGMQVVQLVRGVDHQSRAPYQISSLLEIPPAIASAGRHLLSSTA